MNTLNYLIQNIQNRANNNDNKYIYKELNNSLKEIEFLYYY